MFEKLNEINAKPRPFSVYTAESLWADPYRAQQMLALHLNEKVDMSSRNPRFIDASTAWMMDHFDLKPGKSVCDFGCGPGLYTSRLAQSGAAATGIDFSKNSIRYAREQAEKAQQQINYVHANYLEYQHREQFDLITMIMCDYCALGPEQRRKLLGIFRECLKDDGALLLDVYSMAAFAEREDACLYEKNQLNHFWCAEDYYCFVNTHTYEDQAVVLDKYSIFPESGGEETVYNWLQYFSPEGLTEELRAGGFAVERVYGDVSGAAYAEEHPEFAVVARKA
ncbi:SAM-dependent methyltransferase [Alterisphingorhabdus coralli]|uniref:Class I SAM-dependent methyltransferase n=1 Tax=Alterisphingorhabdus coralli TaxID=3071408 RepID=A0AA97F5C6_9SPHN|nr:class I SAM-dependent methyltransferase [Parasphingorhabdus sp. SCSIO 66989]WOE74589.1 class I SAM-dependent methyltransferase [Parasphingorhabdus sp. SCSIO 66989]